MRTMSSFSFRLALILRSARSVANGTNNPAGNRTRSTAFIVACVGPYHRLCHELAAATIARPAMILMRVHSITRSSSVLTTEFRAMTRRHTQRGQQTLPQLGQLRAHNVSRETAAAHAPSCASRSFSPSCEAAVTAHPAPIFDNEKTPKRHLLMKCKPKTSRTRVRGLWRQRGRGRRRVHQEGPT